MNHENMNHFYCLPRHFKIPGDNSGIPEHENFHFSQSYLDLKWEEESKTHVARELQ